AVRQTSDARRRTSVKSKASALILKWKPRSDLRLFHFWMNAGVQLQSSPMPRKKKKEIFNVSKVVKATARKVVGTPKPTREIPDAKSKQEHKAAKHKPTLGKMV